MNAKIFSYAIEDNTPKNNIAENAVKQVLEYYDNKRDNMVSKEIQIEDNEKDTLILELRFELQSIRDK